MMKTVYYIALMLASVGNNVYANGGVATPFGIKMGEPGSCSAIDKKFRELDPAIQREIVDRSKYNSFESFSYEPSEKLFPGAKRNVSVSCMEGKLLSVGWSIKKGDYDRILWDVASQLNLKYQRSEYSQSTIEIVMEGGEIIYRAVESDITLYARKKDNFFLLMYHYKGLIANSDIEANRKEKEKEKEEMLHRKGAL